MNYESKKTLRLLGKILFTIYVGFLIWFLLFSDWYGRTGSTVEYHYNLTPFREIKRFWEYRNELGIFAVATNLAGNILIFVPFGFFLPMASKYRSFFATVIYSFGLSLCVETFQLLTKVGSFDVDDMILNTLGGIIGYILFSICDAIRRSYVSKRKRKRKR